MFVISFITLLQGKGILLFPCFFKEKAYVTYRPDAQRVAFYGLLLCKMRHIAWQNTVFCMMKYGLL